MSKITRSEFILKAIELGRQGNRKGLHSVHSGLEAAFIRYFGQKANFIKTVRQLEKESQVTLRSTKGGLMLYKPSEAPKVTPTRQEKATQLLTAIKASA